VNRTEHSPKSTCATTGFFAMLGGFFTSRGTGAPAAGAISASKTRLLVSLAVTAACFTFTASSAFATEAGGQPAGEAPTIENLSVSAVTEHDATLKAQINTNGLETTYEFGLGKGCYPESCTAISGIPLPPAQSLSGSEGPEAVSLDLNSAGVTLQRNSEYYYWVIATNAAGRTVDEGGVGDQAGIFMTPPAPGAPSPSQSTAPPEQGTEPHEQTAEPLSSTGGGPQPAGSPVLLSSPPAAIDLSSPPAPTTVAKPEVRVDDMKLERALKVCHTKQPKKRAACKAAVRRRYGSAKKRGDKSPRRGGK
jgi:hypothetical protein